MTGLLVGLHAGLVLLATQVLSITSPVSVAAFAARLRDAVDLDAVRSDLLTAVNTAVEPARIAVWTGPCSPAAGSSGAADQFRVA